MYARDMYWSCPIGFEALWIMRYGILGGSIHSLLLTYMQLSYVFAYSMQFSLVGDNMHSLCPALGTWHLGTSFSAVALFSFDLLLRVRKCGMRASYEF
jgi:hypothetical protein